MSVGTLMMVMAMAIQSGAVSPNEFIPASRAYVMAQIVQQTKGLPFLVESALSSDLDQQKFLVDCMHKSNFEGTLKRLEDEYYELMGHRYQHKSCVDLEAKLSNGAR